MNNKHFSIIRNSFSFGVSMLLANLAQAQASAPGTGTPTAPQGPSFLMQLPVFIGIFALMYLLIIRPQKQQAKKHAEFIESLKKGDEVVLSSGFIGTIVGLTDKVATLEIAEGVETKVLRSQIQGQSKDLISPQA